MGRGRRFLFASKCGSGGLRIQTPQSSECALGRTRRRRGQTAQCHITLDWARRAIPGTDAVGETAADGPITGKCRSADLAWLARPHIDGPVLDEADPFPVLGSITTRMSSMWPSGAAVLVVCCQDQNARRDTYALDRPAVRQSSAGHRSTHGHPRSLTLPWPRCFELMHPCPRARDSEGRRILRDEFGWGVCQGGAGRSRCARSSKFSHPFSGVDSHPRHSPEECAWPKDAPKPWCRITTPGAAGPVQGKLQR